MAKGNRKTLWQVLALCLAPFIMVLGVTALPATGAALTGASNAAVESPGAPPAGDDNDRDGIPDPIEDELARRFAPVVRLHPADVYRPANIPWYLPRVMMSFDLKWWFDYPIIKLGRVNPLSLLGQSNRGQCCGLADTRTSFFLEQTDKDGGDRLDGYRRQTRCGMDPPGWVCYVHARPAPDDHQGMYDLQYIVFYSYNGDIARGPLESGHEADFEHVTVRVEQDRETIHGVYYPAHEGEGRWYERETSPGAKDGYAVTADGRPIVYSALNSHASHPWAGEWVRKRNFNDFTKDGGPEWDCRSWMANLGEKAHPRAGMEWVQYSGRWGEIGEAGWTTSPYGPAYQDWWDGDPPEGASSATSPASLNSGGIVIAAAAGILIMVGLLSAIRRLARRAPA